MNYSNYMLIFLSIIYSTQTVNSVNNWFLRIFLNNRMMIINPKDENIELRDIFKQIEITFQQASNLCKVNNEYFDIFKDIFFTEFKRTIYSVELNNSFIKTNRDSFKKRIKETISSYNFIGKPNLNRCELERYVKNQLENYLYLIEEIRKENPNIKIIKENTDVKIGCTIINNVFIKIITKEDFKRKVKEISDFELFKLIVNIFRVIKFPDETSFETMFIDLRV